MLKKSRMVFKVVGVLVYELPKYMYFLGRGESKYLEITNRNEKISVGPGGVGYVCLWPYTSKLHAPILLPQLGQALLCSAINEWSFSNKVDREVEQEAEMTVVIGHRGKQRIRHLLTTIASLAAQKGVEIECIVVEQDKVCMLKDYLPNWVRHVHQKTGSSDDQYNRSAAFNYGVSYARGDILLLHDNDMIIPEDYCKEILRVMRKGYEVVNLKRFVFYLNREDSNSVMINCRELGKYRPEYIVQNLEAGGSIAITKRGYLEIGGMDEEFVGWGGEDNEFWDRATHLRKWIWGYLPVIHLWHESQRLKNMPNNINVFRAKQMKEICREERIKELCVRNNKGKKY